MCAFGPDSAESLDYCFLHCWLHENSKAVFLGSLSETILCLSLRGCAHMTGNPSSVIFVLYQRQTDVKGSSPLLSP